MYIIGEPDDQIAGMKEILSFIDKLNLIQLTHVYYFIFNDAR